MLHAELTFSLIMRSCNICTFIIDRALKTHEIMMFVRNQLAKSGEILMFVCLQRDAKQCCDATKLDRTMSTIELCLASFWRQTNIKIS